MSPCREDFVSFQEIAPRPLTAANQEAFMAHGIGDPIVTVPDSDEATQWSEALSTRLRWDLPAFLSTALMTPVSSANLMAVAKSASGAEKSSAHVLIQVQLTDNDTSFKCRPYRLARRRGRQLAVNVRGRAAKPLGMRYIHTFGGHRALRHSVNTPISSA